MNSPWIPDPTAEEPTRPRATYCLVLRDDYSRRVVAGRFAWAADAASLRIFRNMSVTVDPPRGEGG